MDQATSINSPTPPVVPVRPEINRVRVIERSLLLFNISWLGLIPLLGIVPALIALWLHFKVRKEVHWGWNPARKYEYIGAFVAYLSTILSVVLWGVLFLYLFRGSFGE